MFFRLVALFVLLLASTGATQAQTFTWNGGGANNNWSTGANWGGTAPGTGGAFNLTLNFNGSTRPNTIQDLGSPFTFQNLNFNGTTNFSITGSALQVDGTTNGPGSINHNSTSNLTITPTTRMAFTNTIGGAGSGTLTFGDLWIDTGTTTVNRNITVNNLQMSSLTSADPAVLTISGSNVVTLNGNLVFNGDPTNSPGNSPPAIINGTGSINLGGTVRNISGGYSSTGIDPFIDIDIRVSMTGTGGINIVGSSNNVGWVRFNAVNTYVGPTSMEANSELLYLGVAGAIPSNSSVTIDALVRSSPDDVEANATNQNIGNLNGGVNGRWGLGDSTLTLGNNTATATFAGVVRGDLVNGSGLGSGGVTKVGSGTQIFSGNNVYRGTTTINGGKLLVNTQTGTNSGTGTGAVIINNSGSLGGNGRAAGAITVNTGGTIMGGDGDTSTGSPVLNLGSSVTFANGARTRVAVGGAPGTPVNSSFTAVGALTPASGANVMTIDIFNDNTNSMTLFNSYTITFATFGSTTATAANFTPNAVNFIFQGTPIITVNATTVQITFVPVPEPTTILGLSAGVIGFAGLVRRKMRSIAV